MKFPIKGFFYGLAATVLWASFYPVSRFLMLGGNSELPPLPLTWVRLAISSAVIIPFMVLNNSGKKLTEALRLDWKMLLLLALLGNVGEGYLLLAGLSITTAARASLMANASPIFTVIIAFFLLREKAGWQRIAGMFIGFAGIGLTLLSRSGGDCFVGGGMHSCWGDLLALASGGCWAAYTVCGTRVSQQYGGGAAAILAIALASLILLPFMFVQSGSWQALAELNWKGWLVILYLSIFVNGFANMLWYKALKVLSSGALGSFGYISALLASGFSVILLKENITLSFMLAMLLVIGGVALMLRNNQQN